MVVKRFENRKEVNPEYIIIDRNYRPLLLTKITPSEYIYTQLEDGLQWNNISFLKVTKILTCDAIIQEWNVKIKGNGHNKYTLIFNKENVKYAPKKWYEVNVRK